MTDRMRSRSTGSVTGAGGWSGSSVWYMRPLLCGDRCREASPLAVPPVRTPRDGAQTGGGV